MLFSGAGSGGRLAARTARLGRPRSRQSTGLSLCAAAPSSPVTCCCIKRKSAHNKSCKHSMVRETGLEPVRVTPHAPQTCASADSATLATARILYHFAPEMSSLFQEKVRVFFTFASSTRAVLALSRKSKLKLQKRDARSGSAGETIAGSSSSNVWATLPGT